MSLKMLYGLNRKQLLFFVIAVASALATLLIPFVFFSPKNSMSALRAVSYWGMAAMLVFFVWFLRSEIKTQPRLRGFSYRHWVAISASVMCALWTVVHNKFEYRILFDEFVLGNVALSYHCNSDAGYTLFGPDSQGRSVSRGVSVDKRPGMFPFVVSVFHGLFGYSPNNVFILNVVLTIILFLLLHFFVSWIAGHRWGVFSQFTLASLPLLGLSSTSGGYEIMNLCWIMVLSITGLHYIRSEGDRGLNLMIASAVILASCRYESILYTLLPVGLVGVKLCRERRLSLTPFASLSPFFVIFPLMSNRVFYSNDEFFQTEKGSFFGWDYYLGNVRAAGSYLFDISGVMSNSIWLSVLWVVSIVLLMTGIFVRKRSIENRMRLDLQWVLLFLMVLVFSNTAMALSVFWGAWPDPITSRFSLPLHLLMVLMIALSWRLTMPDRLLPIWACALPLVFIAAWGSCVSGRQIVKPSPPATYGYNWILREPPVEWDKYDTLVVSYGAGGSNLYGYHSMVIFKNEQWFRDSLNVHVAMGVFSRIVFAEYHKESPFKGKLYDFLDVGTFDYVILEEEDRMRYSFDMDFRLSRFMGMKMPVPIVGEESAAEPSSVESGEEKLPLD